MSLLLAQSETTRFFTVGQLYKLHYKCKSLQTHGAIAPVNKNASLEIIAAPRMIKTANGKIALVTNPPQATPSSRPTAAVCPVSQQ